MQEINLTLNSNAIYPMRLPASELERVSQFLMSQMPNNAIAAGPKKPARCLTEDQWAGLQGIELHAEVKKGGKKGGRSHWRASPVKREAHMASLVDRTVEGLQNMILGDDYSSLSAMIWIDYGFSKYAQIFLRMRYRSDPCLIQLQELDGSVLLVQFLSSPGQIPGRRPGVQ